MKANLMALSGKTAASGQIAALLREAGFWKSASVVYGYLPMRTEPDWREAESDGKILAYPQAVASGLAFVTASEFRRGPHGAHEPLGDLAAPPPDLVLVPGMAFDLTGRRLGRGGGYYDRFLETLTAPRPVLCGVCFGCQIVSEVPAEVHDSIVDYVLSEAGLVRCESGQ